MPPLAGAAMLAPPPRQIAVAGGARDIDLAARHGQAADAAARRQVAQVLGPGRRGGDVAAGIFGQDGMAVLRAGDIEAAIGGGGGGRHTVIAAGAELVFRQQFALGIELGEDRRRPCPARSGPRRSRRPKRCRR